MIRTRLERKATLLGENAPVRVDPIALAASTGPKENSTENLERIPRGQGRAGGEVIERRRRAA